jgi:hypothetical protein
VKDTTCAICGKDIGEPSEYGSYNKGLDGSWNDLCTDHSKELLNIEVEYQVRRTIFWKQLITKK